MIYLYCFMMIYGYLYGISMTIYGYLWAICSVSRVCVMVFGCGSALA